MYYIGRIIPQLLQRQKLLRAKQRFLMLPLKGSKIFFLQYLTKQTYFTAPISLLGLLNSRWSNGSRHTKTNFVSGLVLARLPTARVIFSHLSRFLKKETALSFFFLQEYASCTSSMPR